MTGPAENDQSMGIGKKVEPRPVIVPDWKHRPDIGPHIYQHRDGKLKNAPPPPPRQLTPAEEFFEMFAKGKGGLFP